MGRTLHVDFFGFRIKFGYSTPMYQKLSGKRQILIELYFEFFASIINHENEMPINTNMIVAIIIEAFLWWGYSIVNLQLSVLCKLNI